MWLVHLTAWNGTHVCSFFIGHSKFSNIVKLCRHHIWTRNIEKGIDSPDKFKIYTFQFNNLFIDSQHSIFILSHFVTLSHKQYLQGRSEERASSRFKMSFLHLAFDYYCWWHSIRHIFSNHVTKIIHGTLKNCEEFSRYTVGNNLVYDWFIRWRRQQYESSFFNSRFSIQFSDLMKINID